MVYISLDHRKSSSVFGDTNFLDLEVTHRGMHRFIPRHQDEIVIEIGDPIHVFRLDDDLWCEGQPFLHTLLHLYIVTVFSGFYLRTI